MIDSPALLHDLQRELAALEPDLRRRAEELPDLAADLRQEYDEAFRRGRTAATYGEWRDEQVTQAAVAWLLGCVFVRFCEDNALVSPVWLAGPDERRTEAADAHAAYFQAHPERNDRDWLLEAFHHLEDLPATRAIFDERHNPLWRIQLSADAAERLVRFWRRTDAEGRLIHGFANSAWDTRFLGDLYQDISETARKRYALLQTPEFVEEFILDRTLEPAIEERGVEGLKLIDPCCGSGHFLLGAFKRLLAHWHEYAPGMDTRERVQRVLDAIHGVDINPFAAAIAEFRLTMAALRASGMNLLNQAPAFHYHLAVGDSLLHGQRQTTFEEALTGVDADEVLSGFTYAAEDLDALRAILTPGQYDVVVGNPPYITVRDKALSEAYRLRYASCYRQYALSVPFCERFFQLAKRADDAGWVGQITANSFIKREFGKKLIEDFLSQTDLVEVIDTSGAYIPGHGIPTVILVGRNRVPREHTVRAILSIRGEPSTPDNPRDGLVWMSIKENVDMPGAENTYVTVTDLERALLSQHPWSLSGGGAVETKSTIDTLAASRLRQHAVRIGFFGMSHADEVFILPQLALQRRRLHPLAPQILSGEDIRDWSAASSDAAILPYSDGQLRKLSESEYRLLWPWRTELEQRKLFGGDSYRSAGRAWWSWHQLPPDSESDARSIAYAEVTTHNHFVLANGHEVFKQTAPLIKLPRNISIEEHFRLLGLLNSATACFWLKQMSQPKAGGGVGRGMQDEAWEERYAFNGTKLEDFPLPTDAPTERARRLDALARSLKEVSPSAACAAALPSQDALADARDQWLAIRTEMIAQQEELDWEAYRLYGLLDEDLTYSVDDLPQVNLGERAFEIVLARKVAASKEQTAWFARHGSTPITEIPARWPAPYRQLVNRRIELIESQPDLALIERPECKRRWAVKPWEEQEKEALRDWLLGRLEAPALWTDGQGRPQPQSVAQLADRVNRDADFLSVLELYVGSPDHHLTTQLTRLMIPEAVPYLAAWRYTDSGLRKRAAWEEVWGLQLREDAGEQVGTIPVPPKYSSADFAKPSYWHHRGKLDVPKERFIAYPGTERDTDPAPVLGWAGWGHLEQAVALATLVLQRTGQEGWAGERLKPLLAGLAELEPWLHQWHAEPDPAYGGPPAAYISTFLAQRLAEHELTRADLAAWRPPRPQRGRARRTAASTPEGAGR